ISGGAPVERAARGSPVEIVLRETPFYAESGGQMGDTGTIQGPLGLVRVTDTHSPIPGIVTHFGEVAEGEIAMGEPVRVAGDVVRICKIGNGEIFSFELCGGTHAHATGEIGAIHIEAEGSVAAGTRRLEAVTGRGAVNMLHERHVLMESLSKQLQTSPADLT